MDRRENPTRVDEFSEKPSGHQRPGWFEKLAAVVYVFFCFELGAFLVIFPWVDLWAQNFISHLGPQWYQFWTNPYFRGAVSGMGVVNISISISELVRLRRFARSRQRDIEEYE